MAQQARNVTMKDWGFLAHSRYLLHDRDGKFCPVFREVIQAGKVKPLKLVSRVLTTQIDFSDTTGRGK